MAKNQSEKSLKRLAYTLTVLCLIIIMLPLVYIISLSLQDESAIYSYPPKLLPKAGTSISIVLDYSKGHNQTEQELLNSILKDSTLAMYSTIYELNKTNVGEVKVYGMKDGKTIFYSRAHGLMLKIQLQYGVYFQTRVASDVLLAGDRYIKSTEQIGYIFNMDGVDKSYGHLDGVKNQFESRLSKNMNAVYKTIGEYKGSVVSHSYKLLLENYKYYFMMPTFVYKNYPTIKKYSFLAFMFNTVLTFVWAVICQVVLTSLCAYPLSKLLSKKVSDGVLLFFLITLMIPWVCIMIPQLILMQDWGMYNNYVGMLFPWLLPAPFFIFLFKGFFDRIPSSFFDAARIDGANELYCYFKVCMPMSKPIITLIALQSFISGWGDFMWYYLVANKPNLWTLNVAIYTLSMIADTKKNILMGLSVATILPVMIITAVFSKQIKDSVISSGIKG